MSVYRSQLVAEVNTYCGELPDRPLKDGGLPQNLVFQVLVESEDEMLRDLDLSAQNRRVSRFETSLYDGIGEVAVPGDFGAPAYVALQADPSNDVWFPVEITNAGSLVQAGLDQKLAVSFRDTPSVMELSWMPDSPQSLRVWYDRGGNDNPVLLGSTELGNLYDSYLKLRTAAQCRELLGLEVGKVLGSRLIDSQRQWKRYVSMSRQQGMASKPMVFIPPRLRNKRSLLDPTRFYLPR